MHVTLASEVAVVSHGSPFTLTSGSAPKSEPSIVKLTRPAVGRSVVSPTMLVIFGLTQGVQAVRSAFTNSPALHVEHTELPAGATRLSPQSVQVGAPATLNVPGLHVMHEACEASETYFPGSHSTQRWAPSSDIANPLGQAVQVTADPETLNVPGSHVAHPSVMSMLVRPSTPLARYPAGQKDRHASAVICPSLGLYRPAGQRVQSPSLFAPGVSR